MIGACTISPWQYSIQIQVTSCCWIFFFPFTMATSGYRICACTYIMLILHFIIALFILWTIRSNNYCCIQTICCWLLFNYNIKLFFGIINLYYYVDICCVVDIDAGGKLCFWSRTIKMRLWLCLESLFDGFSILWRKCIHFGGWMLRVIIVITSPYLYQIYSDCYCQCSYFIALFIFSTSSIILIINRF